MPVHSEAHIASRVLMPSKSNPTFSVLTTTTNKPSRLALSSGVSALPTCGARAISSEPLCWGNSGGGVVVGGGGGTWQLK